MVSPTAVDQSMLRKLDRPSFEAANGTSLVNGDRRESVDSRINQGFGEMRLQNSPYASNNPSTTSIQGTLQQQRHPGGGERLSSRFSNSYAPNTERFGNDGHKQTRTAPTITGPAAGSVAHAAEPTKGQAWAFPDEPVQKISSQARSSLDNATRHPSYLESRRSSIASIGSSQYTTESRLPPGQRRLDEPYDPLRRASSEFQGASLHHHHSLQNRQLSDLQDGEDSPTGSNTPYSRTPELRVSHKMAERKRRTEMKELFDNLRDLMPQERGSKASKWEILSKGRMRLTACVVSARLTVCSNC